MGEKEGMVSLRDTFGVIVGIVLLALSIRGIVTARTYRLIYKKPFIPYFSKPNMQIVERVKEPAVFWRWTILYLAIGVVLLGLCSGLFM